MKKIVIIMSVLVLTMYAAFACAEDKTAFDHSVLAGLNGYSYDKFDKTWQYVAQLILQRDSDDVVARIGVLAVGSSKAAEPAAVFHAGVMPKNTLLNCEKVVILIEDTMYTIESINAKRDYNYIKAQDREIIERIISAENMSIRLYAQSSKYDFEVGGEELKDFREQVQILIDNGFFEYLEKRGDQEESMFTVE